MTGRRCFGISSGLGLRRSSRAQAPAGSSGKLGFDGYAIGGVSVGEPEPEMMLAVENAEAFLPLPTRWLCDGPRNASADD